MTSGKNNSWISFLVPKMAFLSQLAGRKKKAVFSMWALLGVLEVRGLYLQVLERAAGFRHLREPREWSSPGCRVPLLQSASPELGEGEESCTCSLFNRHLALLLLLFFKKKNRKGKRLKLSTLSQQLLVCYWACKSDSCSFNIFIVLNMTQNIYYKLWYLHNVISKFST